MTRVRVDFNSRGVAGTVRGSLRRSDGEFGVALPAHFSVAFTGVGIAERTSSGVPSQLPPATFTRL